MTVDPVGPQNRLSLTLLLQQVTFPRGGGGFQSINQDSHTPEKQVCWKTEVGQFFIFKCLEIFINAQYCPLPISVVLKES